MAGNKQINHQRSHKKSTHPALKTDYFTIKMADESDQKLREIQGEYLDFLDDEVFDKVWMYEEIMTNDDNLESSLLTSILLKMLVQVLLQVAS